MRRDAARGMHHRRGNTIPGPCRDRQSCRFLETGPLFPPLAVLCLFPPLSSKEIALHSPRPVGQGSHRSVSFSSPHRTRSAGLRRGPRWSCQRKRAVHGPREKTLLSKLSPCLMGKVWGCGHGKMPLWKFLGFRVGRGCKLGACRSLSATRIGAPRN